MHSLMLHIFIIYFFRQPDGVVVIDAFLNAPHFRESSGIQRVVRQSAFWHGRRQPRVQRKTGQFGEAVRGGERCVVRVAKAFILSKF